MAKGKMVYVVGTQESLKTNQWQAMTDCETTAELYAQQHGLDTIKEVEVRPQRQPRGKRRASN